MVFKTKFFANGRESTESSFSRTVADGCNLTVKLHSEITQLRWWFEKVIGYVCVVQERKHMAIIVFCVEECTSEERQSR